MQKRRSKRTIRALVAFLNACSVLCWYKRNLGNDEIVKLWILKFSIFVFNQPKIQQIYDPHFIYNLIETQSSHVPLCFMVLVLSQQHLCKLQKQPYFVIVILITPFSLDVEQKYIYGKYMRDDDNQKYIY